jgi:photosynthetic reaction center cytochrome c subunit
VEISLAVEKMGYRILALAFICLQCVTFANAQSGTEEKPLMAEQVFKNVQVLKGIPVNQFMDTMGFFAASLGLNCVFCHVPESLENWDKFAEDVPRKRTARLMITMVNNINKTNFGGRRALTCYSCHRGGERPKVVPSLAEQYAVATEDPNEVEIVANAPAGLSADQILDKYIQAAGGAEHLASLTSFVGKGTYEGYDTYHVKVPLEVYAQAPRQLAEVVHTQNGDNTTVFDGRRGWAASVDKPVRLLPLLPGAELDAAMLDADLWFPAQIKQALSQWRVGFPLTSIEDHDIQIVQGRGQGGTRIKLFFDQGTGLLARVLRYTDTVVGVVPTQIDYSDYRDVSGVKLPFHRVVTWTNGQAIIELNEVQANAAVDPAKFAQLAPAVLKAGKPNPQ